MSKARGGRPTNIKTQQRNADEVEITIMRERALAKMSATFKDGDKEVKNSYAGKKLKGQQRIPRSLTKEVIPDVAKKLEKPEDLKLLSSRTLERHHAEHRAGTVQRMADEITARMNEHDRENAQQNMARQRKEQPIVDALNKAARKLSNQ
jgi:hypothetical protein